MLDKYDVIVVGGGHAGCEAARASALLGSKTLLVTMNMNTIAQMSCNPAMGGVAKGQIVREIDALGGVSGVISDITAIQFRMLNKSKGPAMWSPRVQSDRVRFAEEWRLTLERTPNLDFWQDTAEDLLVENGRVTGVATTLGIEIKAKAIVLTNGTFLNGLIHIGEKQFGGGRAAERAVTGLSSALVKLGFESGRMKTGTPPRIDGRSLNYSVMEEQMGDALPGTFSFGETKPLTQQRSCHITYTNEAVHEELKKGFDKSPMFNGQIKSIGPRYCPSIEDKIDRFADRDRHQIFVEPEGWNTVEVYVNGFSTSLPEEVQLKAIRKIVGFEKAKMFRPGYAIEYDFFPPTQLKNTLETNLVEGLYFAGQINGTTGYEEAACQGLMAGINAHLKLAEERPLVLNRNEAYIGVLIDDLINKGTDEPYRMFTSRAEYRILLRQDNADSRLTPIGHKIGLVSDTRLDNLRQKEKAVSDLLAQLENLKLSPSEANEILAEIGSSPIREKASIANLIKRPDVGIANFTQHFKHQMEGVVAEQAEILVKYANYINKEQELAEKTLDQECLKLSPDLNYNSIKGLSNESRQKLEKIRPETLGQAGRISGVSPSDIAILMVYINR